MGRARAAAELTERLTPPGEGYTGIGKDFLDMENMLVLADRQGIFGSSMSDSTRAMVRVVIQNFLKKPVISTVFKADE